MIRSVKLFRTLAIASLTRSLVHARKAEATFKVIVYRHLLAAVKRPHHYVTAAVISAVLMLVGHATATEHGLAWLYALAETVVTGVEEAV